MNLCSDDHEEVCFNGRNCPLCEMKKYLENQLDENSKTIESLQDDIDSLTNQLSEKGE